MHGEFPSAGDTSYAGVVPIDDSKFLVDVLFERDRHARRARGRARSSSRADIWQATIDSASYSVHNESTSSSISGGGASSLPNRHAAGPLRERAVAIIESMRSADWGLVTQQPIALPDRPRPRREIRHSCVPSPRNKASHVALAIAHARAASHPARSGRVGRVREYVLARDDAERASSDRDPARAIDCRRVAHAPAAAAM